MRKRKGKAPKEPKDPTKKKGKGKALKVVLFVILPLALLLGGGTAAILLRIVKVPALEPYLAKATAKNATPPKEKPTPKSPKPKVAKREPLPPPAPRVTVAAKPVAPTTDPAQGVRKVAKLWNELEPEKLQEIVADWKDPELAKVLARMEVEKVAELLSVLPPDRASKLSRAIQSEASKLAPIKA
jgi:hypothetical protein